MTDKIKLGQEVKDKITGFQGIAVNITQFLYGCRRVGVSPKEIGQNGQLQEDLIFDEPQLDIVGNGILPEPEPEPNHGNPNFRPTKH